VGFTRRTDTNSYSWFARYNTDPKPKAKLISTRVFNFANASFDWEGRLTDIHAEASLGLEMARSTSFSFSAVHGYERVFEEEFGPRRTSARTGAFFGPDDERAVRPSGVFVGFNTNPSDKFWASIHAGHIWNSFDFDFGAGPRYPRVSPPALSDPFAPLDPGPARSWEIGASVSYKPTESLNSSLGYSRSTLRRNDTDLVVYVSNIYSLNATYQFTRFSFARARIDYDTLSSNARGQFLFGWTPNPGTAFYLGYNDDLNYNGFNPFTSHLEPGFRRNNRAFFIKMSYLIRRSL
jgi:hypothetical protein